MCFTIGPVIRVEKSPEILVGFVKWIFVEVVSTETAGGFRQVDFQLESTWRTPPTEIKKNKGNKPLILPILAKWSIEKYLTEQKTKYFFLFVGYGRKIPKNIFNLISMEQKFRIL